MVTGAFSSAAAWIWAPAIFVSSQIAYTKGLPGVFWFVVPNCLALFVFGFFAKRVRDVMEKGYTLPEYIKYRLGARNQLLYGIVMTMYAVYAIMVQLTGSMLLLTFATNLSKPILIVTISVGLFVIASFRGIRSAVVADILKISTMLIVVLIITPVVITSAGGGKAILSGVAGANGLFSNVLDASVAWTYGIPISVSLICGIVIDQQEWQRAFSIKRESVKKSFLAGSFIFVLLPVALSLLGFIASSPNKGVTIENSQLSGIAVVAKYFPSVGVVIFVVMLLFALLAAGSSALCAISSIVTVDVYKQHFNKTPSERQVLFVGRATMLVILFIGSFVSLIPNISILYLQLLSGAFKGALFAPTLLALFWKRLSAQAAFWSVVAGLSIGIPLFILGSILNNPTISTLGSIAPIVLGFSICFIGSKRSNLN
jgi:Na+/proline symporter